MDKYDIKIHTSHHDKTELTVKLHCCSPPCPPPPFPQGYYIVRSNWSPGPANDHSTPGLFVVMSKSAELNAPAKKQAKPDLGA
jgi:hypothetical protein